MRKLRVGGVSLALLLGLGSGLRASTVPTDYEQFILEVINRARANPNGEVTRLSGFTWGDDPAVVPGTLFPQPQTAALNEGLTAGTISSAAKPPLAFNVDLIQAARDYANTLLINNQNLNHNFVGTPTTRVQAAGYSGVAGENLALQQSSVSLPINTTIAQAMHDQLFVDNNTTGRGHRTNLMDSTIGYREIGLGLGASTTYAPGGDNSFPNAVLLDEDFGVPTNTNPILTGVVFNDLLHTNFYAPGEGVGGVTILATPVIAGTAQSTTTWSSGGYSLRLSPGAYTVTASGPFGLINLGTTTLGTDNVELNVVSPEPGALGMLSFGAAGILFRRRRALV